ncbi:glycosyltransferase involved in cell wall biosynthesis [Tahibacter aquaticus]|uniref:Glycosyltransferase involved in cell wall biosynthesis n=1 Tax=Tahibacter aquaticus TaxID=520092 RepID=A0A4R6YMI2_9GAMM|nr:glycosyltransferase [Tahibacter aquaticus]TDR38603.1 glycosyltransferase involved in cell wall biosynthesis [Tahibacter aquaticus]
MTAPKLGVLTASHNRRDSLQRLHRALAQQDSVLDWLHVVVDDASDPPIAEADIGAQPGRLAFRRNPRNLGPLITRNTALEIALSHAVDLVAFVDDDDTVTADFFCYVRDMWINHRNVGWFVSRCRFTGSTVPGSADWPAADGVYDWYDDMQIRRRFGADVMHVISAQRLAGVRFSTWGRYQREWTFLARLARSGGFYASNRITKESSYSPDGLTLRRRGPAPDLVTCVSYVTKPAIIALHRPFSYTAWRSLARQLIRFPLRLALLALRRLGLA